MGAFIAKCWEKSCRSALVLRECFDCLALTSFVDCFVGESKNLNWVEVILLVDYGYIVRNSLVLWFSIHLRLGLRLMEHHNFPFPLVVLSSLPCFHRRSSSPCLMLHLISDSDCSWVCWSIPEMYCSSVIEIFSLEHTEPSSSASAWISHVGLTITVALYSGIPLVKVLKRVSEELRLILDLKSESWLTMSSMLTSS